MHQILRRTFATFVLSSGLFLSSLQTAQAEPDAEKMGTSQSMGDVDKSISKEALQIARLHFSNGVELLQADPPNYQDAYYQFQLALGKSGGSWKVRGNLGFCALKLERDSEAIEHYRQYLSIGGDELDATERADIEKELLFLEGNLSHATVSSSDASSQITVKRQGSTAPTQAYELTEGKASLGLRSGALTIVAKSGEQQLSWEPILTPGKKLSHHFAFDAVPPPVAAVAAPAEDPDRAAEAAVEPQGQGPSSLQIVGYATAGVGVLALGGGIVTGLLSQSKETNAKTGCINQICPSDNESDKSSAETLSTTANVLFIAGGVLAAAGVSLVIWGGNTSTEKPTQSSLSLSPGVQRGGGALFATGTF